MDLETLINSSSTRDQAQAAVYLLGEGAGGSRYLPKLLENCRLINPQKELDRHEQTLLGLGAMVLSSFVGRAGFDEHDSFHRSVLQWILEVSASRDVEVVGHSIYALGSLGSASLLARRRLMDMVYSERRSNEHEHVSIRALALRVLRRIDAHTAESFFDTCAFREYAHAVSHWLSTGQAISAESQRELTEESAWIAGVTGRRKVQ